jgi:dihydroorotate dehydrogenase
MYRLARPLLFRLDPERAHDLTFTTLQALGPVARLVAASRCGPPDRRLATQVAGLALAGPVGLAAGLDKDGRLATFWPALGFGFVELGTVTAHPQPGNPRPRLFRLPEASALVNRMGFNNEGSAALARRLQLLRATGRAPRVPLGVNIGKSKITPLEEAVGDYAASAARVAEHADYLVINVSSPNTPGLRTLQDPGFLRDIVAAVVAEAGERPVFVKLSPDLEPEALDDAVRVAEEAGARGLIATNTTIGREGVRDPGPGGLSGRPLRARALAVVRHVAQRTALPVIGVGGLFTADDVTDAIAAGADAVQVYTALIYEGPGLVCRLNRALVARMERDGLRDFAELKAALRG